MPGSATALTSGPLSGKQDLELSTETSRIKTDTLTESNTATAPATVYPQHNDDVDAHWQTNTRRVLQQGHRERQVDLEELYGREFARYYDDYGGEEHTQQRFGSHGSSYRQDMQQEQQQRYDGADRYLGSRYEPRYESINPTSDQLPQSERLSPKWQDADNLYQDFIRAHQELRSEPRRVYSRHVDWERDPGYDLGYDWPRHSDGRGYWGQDGHTAPRSPQYRRRSSPAQPCAGY